MGSESNGRTAHARSPHGGVTDPILLNRLLTAVTDQRATNATMTSRAFGRGLTDPRRDLEDECGYPNLGEQIPAELYRRLYDRDGPSARVVEIFPKECWRKPPTVVEGKGGAATDGPFEQAFEALGKGLNGKSWLNTASANAVWQALYQLDVLCGIGHFGVLLLGFDDGARLDTPVDGSVEYHTGADGVTRNVTDSPPHTAEQIKAWNAETRRRLKDVKGMESLQLNERTEGELLKGDLASDGTLSGWYARDGGVYGLSLNSAAYRTAKGDNGDDRDETGFHARNAAPPGRGRDPAPALGGKRPAARTRPAPFGPAAVPEAKAPLNPLGTEAQYYDYGGVNPGGSLGGSGDEATGRGSGTQGESQDDEFADTGFTPEVRLLYARAYDETLVQIVRYEWDYNSPRFGLPVMYRVTLNDPKDVHSGIGLPLATVMVHWSRVIHGIDGYGQPSSSKCFSPPRMRACLNNLLGLRKVSCGDPEGYWKACVPILAFQTHPQLGGDVIVNRPAHKDMVEQLMNGLQRDVLGIGMAPSYLTTTPTDPTAHKDLQVCLICIKIGCPVPVFQGYEIGEQASTNNDSQWDDQKRGRMDNHLTPNVVANFIDRMILVGALPEPEDGYGVHWPTPEASDAEQADVFSKRMTGFAAYVSGQVEAYVPPRSMLIREAGYSEEEADEIMAEGEDHKEQMMEDQRDQIDAGLAPDPTEPQPQTLGAGQNLVHPQTGETIAKGQPLPPKPGGTGAGKPPAGLSGPKPKAPGPSQGPK